MSSIRRKFVIDTDAGIDDAQAILMALDNPDVEVLALTAVQGNANVHQVGRNLLRTLKLANRLDVPIYIGADESLLGQKVGRNDYQGADGFGESPDSNPPDESLIQKEPVINILMKLSHEHKGELTLVCLGPLTNVACALKYDPTFGSRLKDCFIMGGNYYGRGNITTSAEYNFFCDPEAAHVVLQQLKYPTTLVGWEVCDDNGFPWETYEVMRSVPTKRNTFFKKIEARSRNLAHKKGWDQFKLADEFIMAVALNYAGVVINTKHVHAVVECCGKYTRAQMVVDWENYLKIKPNVKIVTKLNRSAVFDMVSRVAQKET